MSETTHQTGIIHVLEVEGRQLTVSKYRQLDCQINGPVDQPIEHIGRISHRALPQSEWVTRRTATIGRNRDTGALVRSYVPTDEASDLTLIVLGGR